jgi:short-subunit dehydrogenase
LSAVKPVTLITGASSGIGTALASVFAEHDHELVLVARGAAGLSAIADRIEKAERARPQVLTVDLTRKDASDHIDRELIERGLEPAIVVNNAGLGLFGEAARLDRSAQLAIIDLNVRALTDLSLRWVESLARHRGGILNVASLAAFVPGPRLAIYHATKAYALSLSEALHHELKPKGVRVTVLCPGPVETEFQERSGIPAGYHPEYLRRSAERVAREGYKGFMRGRRIIIPGTHNKLAASLLRLLPHGAAMWIARGRANAAG